MCVHVCVRKTERAKDRACANIHVQYLAAALPAADVPGVGIRVAAPD